MWLSETYLILLHLIVDIGGHIVPYMNNIYRNSGINDKISQSLHNNRPMPRSNNTSTDSTGLPHSAHYRLVVGYSSINHTCISWGTGSTRAAIHSDCQQSEWGAACVPFGGGWYRSVGSQKWAAQGGPVTDKDLSLIRWLKSVTVVTTLKIWIVWLYQLALQLVN